MSVDVSTLALEVKSDGVATASSRLDTLAQSGKGADESASKLTSTMDKLGYSAKGLEKFLMDAAAAFALWKVAELTKDIVLLAARYETLGVVMQVVGNNAGHTGAAMTEFQKGLQKTGISAVEARQGLVLMGQAQVDMAKSSQLARVAQDAAVIANTNSSEAFNRMMTGISTGQAIILHHMGLMVNFEKGYKTLADQLGKTKEELTAQELTQARVNEVMRVSVGIAGSYESAMGTAGKQMNSMKRYWQDLLVALGSSAQGPLLEGVTALTNTLKFVTSHFEQIKIGAMEFASVLIGIGAGLAAGGLATWATGVTVAFTALRVSMAATAGAAAAGNLVMIGGSVAMSLFGTATGVATAAVNGLKIAIASNPVGFIVAALTTAVGLWMTYTKVQSDALDRSAPKDNPVLVNLREEISLLTSKIDLIKKSKGLESITDPQVVELKRLEMQKQFIQDQNGGKGTAFRIAASEMERKELEKGIPVVAALKKEYSALSAEKKVEPPGETDYQKLKTGLDAQRKANESYWAWQESGHKAAAKSELELLQWQVDHGISTVKEGIDEKERIQREELERSLKLAQSHVSEAQKDLTAIGGPDGSNYSERTIKWNTAQTTLNQALTKTRDIQSQIDALPQTSALLTLTDEIEKNKQLLTAQQSLLSVQGDTYGAAQKQIAQDELGLKYKNKETEAILRHIDALNLERIAYDKALFVKTTLASLDATNSALAASMVGVNPLTGGIDTVADQTAHDLAVQQDAHQTRMEAIDREREAALHAYEVSSKAASDYALVVGRVSAADTARALSEQENANKTAAIGQKSYRSQLSEAANYTGMAGSLFTALASTQDQSSRKGFESAKAFSIAAAVMNTAAAVMSAMAAPWPMSLAQAALAAATGVIQIAKIASTTFGGGSTSVTAPSGSIAGSSGGSYSGYLGAMPTSSIQDSHVQDSEAMLAAATDRNSIVIGKLSKTIETLNGLFSSGGAGNGLATNAPGRFTTLSSQRSITDQVWDDMRLGTGNALVSFLNPLAWLVGGVSTIFHAFGFGNSWQTTGAGMAVNMSGGNAAVRNYTDYHKDGGWFSSDQNRTDYSANPEAGQYLSKLMQPFVNDLGTMADTLGMKLDPTKYVVGETRISTVGKTSDQIGKELSDLMARTLSGMTLTIDGMKGLVGSYDDAYTRIKQINDAWVTTNAQLQLVGIAPLAKGGQIALNAETAQNGLYGGIKGYETAMSDYRNAMFTKPEQAAQDAAAAQRTVNTAWAEINATTAGAGLTLPKTRDEFNALRASIDPNSPLFAALTQLGTAFATMTTAAEDAAKKLQTTSIDTALAAANALKDIMSGNLSTLSPEAQYRAQQRAFADAQAAGRTAEMPGLGKTLLAASRAYNGSSAGYVTDYATVTQTLMSIAGMPSTSELTLTAVQSQVQLLTDIKDILSGNTVGNLAALTVQLAPNSLPGFAVGTAYVSDDMTANIHQGEIIIDRQSADVLRKYGIPQRADNYSDNSELIAEVRALKASNAELQQIVIGKLTSIETKARLVVNA